MTEDARDDAVSREGAGTPIRRRARIHGRVQGVWFRGSTEEEALRVGVDGWVRNCSDGSVEAVFEGAPDAVQQMLDYVRVGPRWARVERVEVSQEAPLGEQGFRVRG